jgi:hypothetical protein
MTEAKLGFCPVPSRVRFAPRARPNKLAGP